jgi:DNA integration/recombination/inversion protein
MPKIPKPLSDMEIRALKPKDKIYKKCDGRGLYVFINPDGRKYFALEYKSPIDQKIKRINLGDYPRYTLAMARDERFKMEQKIRDGIDIKIKTKRDEEANFKVIAQKWLDIKSTSVSQDTIEKSTRRLERYIYPYFENLDIRDIRVDDVIGVLKKVEEAGALETTKRVYSLLNQIWKSAYNIAPSNIIANINYKFTFKKAKDRNFATLTKKADIKALWQGCDEYNGDVRTKYALKLAILTALRPFNIRSMRWEYIDFEREILKIPAADMKTRDEFTLPLSKQAVNLLREYQGLRLGKIYLFSALQSEDRYMSENTLNVALRRMGFSKDEIVSHGFRAMFSTICNEYIDEHGINFDIIEKCLAHKGNNKIRNTYNHAGNLTQMRKLMQWWADFLDKL